MFQRGDKKLSVRIRPMRKADACLIWNWMSNAGWRNFSRTTWTLCQELNDTCAQWVATDENDKPISYIAVSRQFWGLFVAAYITAEAYRGKGAGTTLWKKVVESSSKQNFGLTANSEMIDKYRFKHLSKVEIIRFVGRMTFLEPLQTLAMGLFNPKFKAHSVQDDRTIEKIIAYDRRLFIRNAEDDPAREDFLWLWMRKGRVTTWDRRPKIVTFYAENNDGLVVGYGSISPANGAVKIGPLYADSSEIARTLLTDLLKHYNSIVQPVNQVFFNVPGNNYEFIDFLSQNGLAVSLSLKQAFSEKVPSVNYEIVYCVTSHFCQPN